MVERDNELYKNETMLQELNRQNAKLTAKMFQAEFPHDFLLQLYCECPNPGCGQRLEIEAFEYHQIAQHGHWFTVLPEHYLPKFEQVVEKTPCYWIIEKRSENKAVPLGI